MPTKIGTVESYRVEKEGTNKFTLEIACI